MKPKPNRAVQMSNRWRNLSTENCGGPLYRCSQISSRLHSFLTYKFSILAKAQALYISKSHLSEPYGSRWEQNELFSKAYEVLYWWQLSFQCWQKPQSSIIGGIISSCSTNRACFFFPLKQKTKKPYTEMLTNIPDPDSLQVTKVRVIKIQISQPFQTEKKSQK